MIKKYARYLEIQLIIMLVIFLTLIFFLARYRRSEDHYQLTNIGQSVSHSLQQHITMAEGVLISLAYNYEIDKNIDRHKFVILADKYMRENEDILYLQHKNKETVTDMVFPDTYAYTLGSSLRERPETEEATNKAIENRMMTANDPYILKNTDQLLGLVVRYPLYREDQFDGFFVAVFDLNSCMDKVTKGVGMEAFQIALYNKKGEIFWGASPGLEKDIYSAPVPVMDNEWTMKLWRKEASIKANDIMILFIMLIVLSLMGLLVYMQAGLFKKDKNLQSLAALHRELERLKESYTLALDSANDALWEWNLKSGEIVTSDKWIEITGNALEGRGLEAILQKETIHREDYPEVLKEFKLCLEGSIREFHREYRIRNKENAYTWVLNRGRVYLDSDGVPNKVAGAVTNIEERKRRESKIEFMAFYDMLTGLPNKVQFMRVLEEVLRSGDEALNGDSILMIDLDNFKIHNDLLGLDFCDQLLKQVGSRLLQIMGPDNMVARFGGDEFLILVRDHKSIKELEILCKGILGIFGSPFELMQKSVYVSASIGMVCRFEPGQTANDVLRNVDTALNKAKESGKNQYCIYDAHMHEEIIRKSKIEECIRQALIEDDFIIHYQPQYDLVNQSIRGVEALARLRSQELGMISPLEFIAVAEYTGLIIPFGNWMLKNACIQGKSWIDRGYNIGKLSVNISVHQLHDGNFFEQMKNVLAQTGFPVKQLELEITESVFLDSSEDNIEILKRLKSLGISIALDDFGTGYSSLNYLTVLPIDVLKIDKSFLGKALDGEMENRVIRSIIELAHDLELKVVSEGVETQKQKQTLANIGCDYIQGYYFARPEAAESVEKWFDPYSNDLLE